MAESYRSKITRQDQLDNIAEGKEPNAPRQPKGETGPAYAKPKPAQVSAPPAPNHPDFEALSSGRKQRYLEGGFDPKDPDKSGGRSLLDLWK